MTTGGPTNVYITGTVQLEMEGSKVWQGDHWWTNVYITGTVQLEVEGSKVWQGDHWRTNQCLHHWYNSAGGGGK